MIITGKKATRVRSWRATTELRWASGPGSFVLQQLWVTVPSPVKDEFDEQYIFQEEWREVPTVSVEGENDGGTTNKV
jgi:hypothetical protein